MGKRRKVCTLIVSSYIHTYMDTTYVHIHIHTYIHTTYVHTYTHTYIRTYMYICTSVHIVSQILFLAASFLLLLL